MVIVLGSATAAPDRRAELVAAAQAVASASRTDSGCLAYSFSADLECADRILSIEVWRDRAALEDHMAHDHTQTFLQAAGDLVVGEPSMSFYDVPTGTGSRRP